VHKVPADAHDCLRQGCDQIRTKRLAGDQVQIGSQGGHVVVRDRRSSAQRALGHVEALIGAFGLRDGACGLDVDQCRQCLWALLEDVARTGSPADGLAKDPAWAELIAHPSYHGPAYGPQHHRCCRSLIRQVINNNKRPPVHTGGFFISSAAARSPSQAVQWRVPNPCGSSTAINWVIVSSASRGPDSWYSQRIWPASRSVEISNS
jgi:hypothetical protein